MYGLLSECVRDDDRRGQKKEYAEKSISLYRTLAEEDPEKYYKPDFYGGNACMIRKEESYVWKIKQVLSPGFSLRSK